jgi:hypothetical protein
MNTGEILIYQNQEGNIKIDVRLEEETVWLTQEQMALLFGKVKSTINEHILNIYAEDELVEDLSIRKFGISDFSTKPTNHYNLDVVISVGYRVKSLQGTQFRIWATQRLKEYIVKGFALNDYRFKTGNSMNYFGELQERIREIRLSERFFYQKIKDIYTTSIYNRILLTDIFCFNKMFLFYVGSRPNYYFIFLTKNALWLPVRLLVLWSTSNRLRALDFRYRYHPSHCLREVLV